MNRTRLRSLDSAGMSRAYRARAIFHPYYTLLNQLAAGEVDATEAGEPVVQFEGQIEAAATVLHGFVACWQRVDARRKVGADLPALTALAYKLEQGSPIPPAELAPARRALDACLRAYKRLPLTLIADAANSVEIESLFEVMGLVEAQA